MGKLAPVDDPYFNPYSAPKADAAPVLAGPGSGLWREGGQLVMAKRAALPDRCFRCNSPADGYRLYRRLSWHPPLYYIIALFNLILYVIVALIVRKTAMVDVPLCPRHRTRRLRAIAIGWALALAGIAAIVVGASNSGPGGNHLAFLILVGVVLFLAGLIGGVIGSQVAVPTKIDKQFVRLKKASAMLLAELPDWPGWAS